MEPASSSSATSKASRLFRLREKKRANTLEHSDTNSSAVPTMSAQHSAASFGEGTRGSQSPSSSNAPEVDEGLKFALSGLDASPLQPVATEPSRIAPLFSRTGSGSSANEVGIPPRLPEEHHDTKGSEGILGKEGQVPLSGGFSATEEAPRKAIIDGLTEHGRTLQRSITIIERILREISPSGEGHQLNNNVRRSIAILSDLLRLTGGKPIPRFSELVIPLGELLLALQWLERDFHDALAPVDDKRMFNTPWVRKSIKDDETGTARTTLLRKASRSTKRAVEDAINEIKTTKGNLNLLLIMIQINTALEKSQSEQIRQLDERTKQLSFVAQSSWDVVGQPSDINPEVAEDESTGPEVIEPSIRIFYNRLYNPRNPYKDCDDSYARRHDYFRSQRMEGTCYWILRHVRFGEWLTSDSAWILWCCGPPGIGKSITTARVIDSLAKNKRNRAYYYMGYGKVQSARGLVLSLLEQLCASGNYVPSCLRPLLPEPVAWTDARILTHEGSDTTPSTESQPTLAVLLDALRELSHRSRDSFIVLDAWDRYNMDSENDFSQVIATLETLPWKLYISSCEEPNVHINTAHALYTRIHIGVNDNASDLKASIHKTLKDEGIDAQSPQFGEELEIQMYNSIIKHSQGIFLYTKINSKIVSNQRSLINLGSHGLRAVLRDLPDEPAHTIKRGLKEMGEQPKPMGALAKTVIIWLTRSRWPLSLPALVESLTVLSHIPFKNSDQDTSLASRGKDLLKWCEGFVLIDHGSSLVHLAPFEIETVAKGLWPKAYDKEVSALATRCLKYLLLEDFESGPCETQQELAKILEEHPFLDYAAHCWSHHVREAHDNRERTWKESQEDDGIAENTHSRYVDEDEEVNYDFESAGPNIEDIGGIHLLNLAEELLKKPNILLALQVLLYTKMDSTPVSLGWNPLLQKVKSMSLLHLAAYFGMSALVDNLIKEGWDPRRSDFEESTPLHEAAKNGFDDIVSLLLASEASVTVVDHSKKTPMHYAKEGGHTSAFNILFEKACADEFYLQQFQRDEDFIGLYSIHSSGISDDRRRSMEISLINAILCGKRDVVAVLMLAGVDANCKNEAGIPTIHLAIQSESEQSQEIVDILLRWNADPSVKSTDASGESALHLAVGLGDFEAVKQLLWAGADINATDAQGRTLLFSALGLKDQEGASYIIKYCLRRGLDINQTDNKGRHILHEVARKGNTSILTMLLYLMKESTPVDNNGKTPLDYAEENHQEDAERLLRGWIMDHERDFR